MQAIAQNALNTTPGAVVIMKPDTGEIIAFVSNPSFDPNLFVTGISQADYKNLANDPGRPLFNRILQGEFPPGSTVKPFYALGALNSKTMTASSWKNKFLIKELHS